MLDPIRTQTHPAPLLRVATPTRLALGRLGTHPACHPGPYTRGARGWPVPSFRNLPRQPFLGVSPKGDVSPRGSPLTFRVLPHGGQIFTRQPVAPATVTEPGLGETQPGRPADWSVPIP